MSFLNTLIIIFVIVCIVLTFITEPITSFNYYKAMVKSGFVVVKTIVSAFTQKHVPINNTINQTKVSENE